MSRLMADLIGGRNADGGWPYYRGKASRLEPTAWSAIALAALAPRVAEAAGGGWREVRCASEPSEAALLALACDMCHEPPPGSGPSG